jgi:hypothetical protein
MFQSGSSRWRGKVYLAALQGKATLHDEKAKVTRAYGCYSIPTVVVLDKSATIIAHFIGECMEKELFAAVKTSRRRLGVRIEKRKA